MTRRLRKEKYVVLSVAFWRDHDLQALSLAARGLFAKALSYCGDQQNDGVLTERDWAIVVAGDVPHEVTDAVTQLVTADVLRTSHGGGYTIPAYAEWNLTRAEIDEKRSAERDRKRKQRKNAENKPPGGDVPPDVPQDEPF